MAKHTHPHPMLPSGVDCLNPASPFLISPFFVHSHLVLSHLGTEACLNLKVAMVVTNKCFCGRLLWVQIPALPLPKCVLYTWDNNASLSAWCWEPNETRYVECLWVCSMPTFSHTTSSVSFLHFFSLVTVMYILPSWHRPHLLFPPGLAPVFISVIRAYKILQLGLWWNMWMVLGAEFHKPHSEFHLGRGCVLFIPTTSWCLEHSRHWINVAGINPLLSPAIRGPKLSWRRE